MTTRKSVSLVAIYKEMSGGLETFAQQCKVYILYNALLRSKWRRDKDKVTDSQTFPGCSTRATCWHTWRFLLSWCCPTVLWPSACSCSEAPDKEKEIHLYLHLHLITKRVKVIFYMWFYCDSNMSVGNCGAILTLYLRPNLNKGTYFFCYVIWPGSFYYANWFTRHNSTTLLHTARSWKRLS